MPKTRKPIALSEKKLRTLPKEIRKYMKYLSKDTVAMKSYGIQKLRDIGHPAAIPHLANLLHDDESTTIRDNATIALWNICAKHPQHAQSVTKHLVKALNDKKADIVTNDVDEASREKQEKRIFKTNLVRALGSIGHPDAIPHLVKAIEKEENNEIRTEELEALGRIGKKLLEQTPGFDEKHPHYPFMKAIQLIQTPAQHPKAFITLWRDLQKATISHLKKNDLNAYAKQLKTAEPIVKAA